MSTASTTDMQVKREDLNPCTIKFDVTCSPEQVKNAFDRTVRRLSKKVRVPGFRPGKAPQKMVEDMLNPQAVYEKTAEDLVNATYRELIEREDITPEGFPSIELKKIDRDEAVCEYTAKVPLAPVVELGETKGLKAYRPEVDVTDEEVDRQIDEFRRSGGQKEDVTDRGVQDGDVTVVNLRVDGEEGDGKTFMVVAGQTFEGLDKALHGMQSEEVKAVKLDYPANFSNPAWAGKSLASQVMVKSISAVSMPELDDAFAQSMNTENVDDLKSKVREAILSAKESTVAEMVRDQLLDDLLAKSTVHVADTTWESVVNRRMQEIGQVLSEQNRTVEDYLKEQDMSEEEFTKRLTEEAQLNVRRAVLIQKIFRDNEMTIEDADVNRHFLQIAQENRVAREDLDRFAKEYGPQLREEVIFRTMAGKVRDLLMESADVTVGEAPAGDAPAKKTAAKKPAAKKEADKAEDKESKPKAKKASKKSE